MNEITFIADKVQVKTGIRIDNSGIVSFVVGEYQLANIKDLVNVVDKQIEVIVHVKDING